MSRRTRIRHPVDTRSVTGWVAGGVGLLIIVGIAAVGLYLNANYRDVERTTGCPTDHYDSVTAVLIDLTDPISAVQSAALRNALLKIRDSVPKYGRLEIYPLAPTAAATIPPLFAACSPGSGRDVESRWYGNPELADRIWHKQFGDQLDALIAKIQGLPSQSRSPIFEAVQSIAVTSFGAPLAEGASSKRLVIVSDMIHYTPELSMYRAVPTFEQFKTSEYYLRVKPDLRSANVDVYLIVRETKHDVQQPPLYKFWMDYFDASNGYLRGWEPLQ